MAVGAMAGVQPHRISNHIKITQNIKSGTQPLFLLNVRGKTAGDAKCCVSYMVVKSKRHLKIPFSPSRMLCKKAERLSPLWKLKTIKRTRITTAIMMNRLNI